jgi:hypothetical protein
LEHLDVSEGNQPVGFALKDCPGCCVINFITHPELGDILIEELGLPETTAGS